ncbi:MAG TPA: hypothetical protein VKV17_22345 [Bryobacteraceae bacterium]|nr:hypothetical protein [Bryobacteraceae bacterium]
MAKILSIEEYRRKQKQLPSPRLERKIQFEPLPWEDPAEIEAMIAGLEQRFPPRDCVGRCLVDNLIHSSWRLRRLEKLRADAVSTQPAGNLKALDRSIALTQRCCASGLRMLQQYHSQKGKKRESRP